MHRMTPTSPRTGDHVAELVERARAEQVTWAAVPDWTHPDPWIADPPSRTVYIDGGLAIHAFYAAVDAGLQDLIGTRATVTQLHRHDTDHRITG